MVDATDNVCWLFLSQETFSMNVTPDAIKKKPESNAELVTVHASDWNSQIKRVVPGPITMAMRRTAYIYARHCSPISNFGVVHIFI